MILKAKILSIASILLFLAAFVPPVQAASGPSLSDNFDSYTVGTQVGDASANPTTIWNKSFFGNVVVTNSGCFAGNCISGSNSQQIATWTGNPLGFLTGSSTIEVKDNTGGNGGFGYGNNNSGDNGYINGSMLVQLTYSSVGVTALLGSSTIPATTITTSFADGVYHSINTTWEITNIVGVPTCIVEISVDGGAFVTVSGDQSWCGATAYNDLYNGGVNAVFLSFGSGTFAANYVDNLSSSLSNQGGNLGTRIDTVTPASDSVNGTSTSFGIGVTGYINDSDFVSGHTFITLQYSNGGFESSQLVGPLAALQQQPDSTRTFTFPITASGPFSFSTTTSMQIIGDYSLNTQLTVPQYSFAGFSFLTRTLVASSTNFVVSTSTAFGTLRTVVQQQYKDFVSNASSTINASVCSPISGNFSIGPCMSILFGFPSFSQLQGDFNQLNTNVLTHQPWAYPTRFFSILTTASTTALPDFTVSVAIASGTETTLSYSPGDMLTGGANLLNGITDPHSGKNMQQILEPFIQLFVAISVLVIIIFDLMAMGHHTKDGGGRNYT